MSVIFTPVVVVVVVAAEGEEEEGLLHLDKHKYNMITTNEWYTPVSLGGGGGGAPPLLSSLTSPSVGLSPPSAVAIIWDNSNTDGITVMIAITFIFLLFLFLGCCKVGPEEYPGTAQGVMQQLKLLLYDVILKCPVVQLTDLRKQF